MRLPLEISSQVAVGRCEFITQMRAGSLLALLASVHLPTALGLLQYDTYCDVLCNGHGRSAVRIASSARKSVGAALFYNPFVVG